MILQLFGVKIMMSMTGAANPASTGFAILGPMHPLTLAEVRPLRKFF